MGKTHAPEYFALRSFPFEGAPGFDAAPGNEVKEGPIRIPLPDGKIQQLLLFKWIRKIKPGDLKKKPAAGASDQAASPAKDEAKKD